MAKDLPPVGGGVEQERRDHLALQVHRYVSEVEVILTNLELGEFGELAQIAKLRRDLMSTAKQLRDAEIELDRVQKQTADQDIGSGIDFDAARIEVERRLDRLRRAGSSG
ncbi:MAG: hypothetical protein AAFO93_07260 [Pseudomonadota bacterium]